MGIFRRKRKDEYALIEQDVPLSTMVRWFVYDIGYGDENVDELIGLSRISEEGATKEMEDSLKRIDSLYNIVPFIDTIAEIASNVLSTIAVGTAIREGEALEDPEETELLNKLYYSISLSSIIGAFSIASTLGIINIAAVAAENKDMKGLFDE